MLHYNYSDGYQVYIMPHRLTFYGWGFRNTCTYMYTCLCVQLQCVFTCPCIDVGDVALIYTRRYSCRLHNSLVLPSKFFAVCMHACTFINYDPRSLRV